MYIQLTNAIKLLISAYFSLKAASVCTTFLVATHHTKAAAWSSFILDWSLAAMSICLLFIQVENPENSRTLREGVALRRAEQTSHLCSFYTFPKFVCL